MAIFSFVGVNNLNSNYERMFEPTEVQMMEKSVPVFNVVCQEVRRHVVAIMIRIVRRHIMGILMGVVLLIIKGVKEEEGGGGRSSWG